MRTESFQNTAASPLTWPHLLLHLHPPRLPIVISTPLDESKNHTDDSEWEFFPASKCYSRSAAPPVHQAQGGRREQVCDDLCILLNYGWSSYATVAASTVLKTSEKKA